jgi:DNA helicase-2/ATP-dependent DNA helicase PcrA
MIESYHYDLFHAGSKRNFVLRNLVQEIGYKSYLESEHPDNEGIVNFKMKGIDFLCDRLSKWERNPDNAKSSIFDFLNRVSLAGKEDPDEENAGKIALMTIHASKGLEFDTVYLAGVEDQYIPHARAIEENPASIDEERRLFYVAITRARRELVISSCEKRRDVISLPSRFLEEIPKSLFDEEDPTKQLSSDEVVDKLRLLRERLALRQAT